MRLPRLDLMGMLGLWELETGTTVAFREIVEILGDALTGHGNSVNLRRKFTFSALLTGVFFLGCLPGVGTLSPASIVIIRTK